MMWRVNRCWQLLHSSMDGFPLGASKEPSRQKQRLALHLPVFKITVTGGDLMGEGGDGNTEAVGISLVRCG